MKYLTIILFLFLSSKAFSHGGGLNKEGCHNNRSTGDYHCHKGFSAKKDKTLQSGSMSFANEDFFNLRLAKHLGGITEISYNYNYLMKLLLLFLILHTQLINFYIYPYR